MASETESGDKPHEPTPKKLEDARKKGELVKSAEVNTAAMYFGFLIAATIFGGSMLNGLGTTMTPLLSHSEDLANGIFRGDGREFGGYLIGAVAMAVAPWVLLPFLTVLTSVLGQRSMVFAPDKLKFKTSRISPVANFKNKFGWNGLFEFFKSAVKLVIYAVILAMFLNGKQEVILGAMQLEASEAILIWLNLSISLLAIVLGIATSIGVIDYLWQFRTHVAKNRMSDKEIRDEVKEAEGDPHLKASRRNKAQEIAFNQMLKQVPEADVVIVNPSHFAVALKWSRAAGEAPVCIAKGVDEIALKIKEIAREEGVAIYSDPPTARALYADVKLDQQIWSQHFEAVAVAIRYAEALRRKSRAWT
ncbi:flagellar type III secretion system protein FlhB [Phaeobacter sp. J2-8]|uniref:EscU/YscU/HrcU family type III secretion system export apparatus switch protein n=1 Tax=Phaeobacter sp. J2-8 TaxID=2931394 RepID=UPI001FD1FED3|nr:flagellar type III secretion system protein FlhB [Phaeobacter sp. J2-8]MCJ7871025.1 flagellar type III secretion system protein FlhB [Phaeobacter sp. J2-8]